MRSAVLLRRRRTIRGSHGGGETRDNGSYNFRVDLEVTMRRDETEIHNTIPHTETHIVRNIRTPTHTITDLRYEGKNLLKELLLAYLYGNNLGRLSASW